MKHIFDVQIAKEYGITEAIILENMWYWYTLNKANQRNFYDGEYWTYNSTRAFTEIFPYLSQRQIQYALKKLVEKNILLTANYNKSNYDRTLWYTFSNFGKCILQNCKMEFTELSNGLDQIVKPIPDINTDVNSDINSLCDFSKFIDEYNNLNLQNVSLTEKRKKAIEKLFKKYDKKIFEVFEIIKKSDYLLGKKSDWKITIDWLLKDENYAKVIEKNYVDKKVAQRNYDIEMFEKNFDFDKNFF